MGLLRHTLGVRTGVWGLHWELESQREEASGEGQEVACTSLSLWA